MRRLTVLLFPACLFSCQNDDNEKETRPEEKESVFRFIDKANITNTDTYEKDICTIFPWTLQWSKDRKD